MRSWLVLILVLGGCSGADWESAPDENNPEMRLPVATVDTQPEQWDEPVEGDHQEDTGPNEVTSVGGSPSAPSGGSSGGFVATGGQTPVPTGGTSTGGQDGGTGGIPESGGSDNTGGEPPIELTCADLYTSEPAALECCLTDGCEIVIEEAAPLGYVLEFTYYCGVYWPVSIADYPDHHSLWSLSPKTQVMTNRTPYTICQTLEAENPSYQCMNVIASGNLVSCWAPNPGCTLPEPPHTCAGE